MSNIRLAALALALLLAAPIAHAQERGPLSLASASYFFVGGKIDTSVEGSPMVGHMYVEYMIPARRTHPYPIVMVHGGSQTGTNFTGTPDGREGWAQHFVRRGYAVYVVDQVARGRSPYWSQVYGPVQGPRFNFTEQRFVAPERSNQWPQAHLHTQWPGAGKAGDPAFDQFYASQFPSLASFPKQGSRGPWRLHQNFLRDWTSLKTLPLDEPSMEFGRGGSLATAATSSRAPAAAVG